MLTTSTSPRRCTGSKTPPLRCYPPHRMTGAWCRLGGLTTYGREPFPPWRAGSGTRLAAVVVRTVRRLRGAAGVGAPVADDVDHSSFGVLPAALRLLANPIPYDGCLVQPGWPHLLWTTLTIPRLACFEQSSAFLLPSTPYNWVGCTSCGRTSTIPALACFVQNSAFLLFSIPYDGRSVQPRWPHVLTCWLLTIAFFVDCTKRMQHDRAASMTICD